MTSNSGVKCIEVMPIRKGVGTYLAKILSDTIIAIRIAKKDETSH